MLCETGSTGDLRRQGWAAEWKWDGTRGFLGKEKGKVTIVNREGIDYTARLLDLRQAALQVSFDFLMDGEIVCLDSAGLPNFEWCQRRCATTDIGKQIYLRSKMPVTFMAFDLIRDDEGHNIEDRPYYERKALLAGTIMPGNSAIKYVEFRLDTEKFYEHVKNLGEEGLILKRVDSRYVHERSLSWLKVKNWRTMTVDVAGYTPGKGRRSSLIGALVLTKDSKYVGKAGSGLSDHQLQTLSKTLKALPEARPSFRLDEEWTPVKTELRIVVKYYKQTKDGIFRFPTVEKVL